MHQETCSVMGYGYSGPSKSTTRTRFTAKKLSNLTIPTNLVRKVQVNGKPHTPKTTSFDKQLHVFKYMGETPPKSFINLPENVVICGMLPSLYTNSTEEEIRKEIVDITSAEDSEYEQCSPDDFEFIRVSRRSAVVPTVKAGFNSLATTPKNY